MAELKFKFVGDDTDIRKKLADLAKLQSESGQAFQKAFKGGGEGAKSIQDTLKQILENTKKATTATVELNKAQSSSQTNAAKEAQLAYMDSLRQSRLEIQKQREEQARLRVALDEGRISQQQYRIEAAKFSLEERKKAAALRETKKEISNNSEYQKLNRALGNLRTESKNLLAEMYRLETQGKKGSTAYQELANKARGVTAQTKVLDGALKKIDASLGLHQRNVGNYGSALDAVSPQFARLNSQLSMMGVNLTELAGNKNAFRELGTTIAGVGRSILTFLISPVGLAIAAIGGFFALIRGNKGTVMDFNSGLLNVSKTTGIAGAALDKLGADVVGLSRKLQTVGTDKLLEYATVAGQLGVKGSQNIMAFTEALAKLETASDITGEKGGAEIARLLTLTDGGVQNVKDFGDEIVNLGNNFAATESEILSNATAIAQNTGLYKVGRQDVLAYATATKAVGLEAEVVGSAMFRTLAQIEKYSNGAKGSEKILSLLGKTQTELSKQFKSDSSGVFNDLIAALNKIDKEGGNVTATLNQLGLNNVRDIRVLGTLASSGYGQLEQAMIDVKDAAGSLDEEFGTAAGKLENQTKRISIAWNNLVLDIENGTGALGKSAVWLSGIFADALDRISKIVAPTGWNEFAASLTSFQAADVIREINIAVKESGEAMQSAMDLDLSKANSDKITETMDMLVSAQDQATKSLELYKKSIESGLLTDKGRTRISELEGLLNRLSSKINQVSMFVPAAKTGGTGAATEGNTLSEAEIKAQARAHETMVNAQRAMQAKIDEMNQSAKRKSMSDSEEEVQAIKDKYEKLTKEAIAFNTDPKNKIKVNLAGLGASESGEISEANYKADTVQLKKGLDEQLRLYNDFEALRKSTSRKVAEERYKEQLPLILGYEKKLQDEIAKIEGKDRSKEEEKRHQQLSEDLKKFNEARLKEEETAAIRIYNLTMTYDDKMLAVQNQYQKDVERLGTKANAENLKILNDGRKAEEKALQKSFVESIDSYQYYLDNIANLSGKKLNEAIKALKKDLEGLLEKHPELKKFVDQINKGIDTDKTAKTAQDFREMGSSLSFMADAIGDFGGGLTAALRTAGDLANQISSIKTDIADFNKFAADGNFLGQLSSGLGIVGAGFNIMTSINTFLDRETRKDRQKTHDVNQQVQATEGLTKALERQMQAANEAYGTQKIKEYTKAIEESNKVTKESEKLLKGRYAFTGDAELDKVIGKMNRGEKLSGWSLWGDSEKDLAKIVKMAPKLTTNVKELEDLIRDGKLDSQTAAIAQNFINAHDAIKDANQAMKEFSTGTNFKQLSDDFAKALTGENPFKKLGDNFEDTIRQSMLNGFKGEGFSKGMQAFYDMLDGAVTEGLTKDNIAGLKKFWDSLGKEQRDLIEELEKETGISFTNIARDIGISLESVQDQFAALFENGTASAEEFGKSFQEIMRNVLMESIKTNYLKDAMEGFYDEIAEMTKDGRLLSKEDIEYLEDRWDKITGYTDAYVKAVEGHSGFSFATDEIARKLAGMSDDILNALINPFDEAGDKFEDSMKKAILNTFKDSVLEKELEGFYKKYAEMTAGGSTLTAEQIGLLRTMYEGIITNGEETIKNLEEMTGLTLVGLKKVEDRLKEISTLFSGLGQSMVDSIIKPFDQVGDAFEDTMKKAILSTFRDGVLEKELQGFYDMYAELTADGATLNATQIDLLRARYDEIIAQGKITIAELEAMTGVTLVEIEKIEEKIRENLTGTSLEGVADAITSMFGNGKSEAIDFAETFEEVMKKAILNIFRTNLLAGELKNFYDTFEEIAQSEGGLTAANMAELRLQYDLMMAGADARFRDLERITGLSFDVIQEVQKVVEIARESIVGTTFESFADGITSMLAKGTTSVQEFGKNFEETMKTAILNTFKTKTLANEMEAFYEQFYQYANAGQLDELRIAQLKAQYDAMIKKGREEMDKLGLVTGLDFTTDASSSGMSGMIRAGITEDTGTKIDGIMRAQYDISKSLLLLQTKEWATANNYNRIGIERLTAIQANTFRTANNTERLADIESHLARMSGSGSGMPSPNKYL